MSSINLEKSILDHLSAYIQQRRIVVTKDQQDCLNAYEKTPYLYGLLNCAVWGYVAYKTLDFSAIRASPIEPQVDSSKIVYESIHGKSSSSHSSTITPKYTPPKILPRPLPRVVRPAWLNVLGVFAISAGAFATTWFCSKLAARDCLQCLLDTRDKQHALNVAVRKVLMEHHPNSDKFMSKEKH